MFEAPGKPNIGNFEPESGENDGALAHLIERHVGGRRLLRWNSRSSSRSERTADFRDDCPTPNDRCLSNERENALREGKKHKMTGRVNLVKTILKRNAADFPLCKK